MNKVKIGDEYSGDDYNYIITDIGYDLDHADSLWAWGSPVENLSRNCKFMMLTTDYTPVYDCFWNYVGTPVKCEDCLNFCKQQCKIKL